MDINELRKLGLCCDDDTCPACVAHHAAIAHYNGEDVPGCDCGPCEQVREDRQRTEDRDAAHERWLHHGDYLYDLAKDGGF